MDHTENPIAKTTEPETKPTEPETKPEAPPVDSVVKPLVEEINVVAKSAIDKVTSSSYVTQVESQVEKLVSDPLATLKSLGSPRQETPCDTTGDTILPTSDKNAGESLETARSVDDSETTENVTKPFIGVGQNASWMNCCGLLNVLKRSDE